MEVRQTCVFCPVYLKTALSPPSSLFLNTGMAFDMDDALDKSHLVTSVFCFFFFFKVHASQNITFALTHSIPLLPAARAC